MGVFEKRTDIFNLLIPFLSSSYDLIQLMTCGIIYTLLGSKTLFSQAHKTQLAAVIQYLSEQCNTERKKNFIYIKNKLDKFGPIREWNTGSEDEDNDFEGDSFFEINESEVPNLDEYLRGYEKISNSYSLDRKQASKVTLCRFSNSCTSKRLRTMAPFIWNLSPRQKPETLAENPPQPSLPKGNLEIMN